MQAIQLDTIAALATPPGEGGISVIRVSGPDALCISDKGFRGRSQLAAALSHSAHFGRFVGPDGGTIDNVVALIFKAPKSYTGEDTVEFSCHGGVLVTRKVLEALLQYGARHAQPGEFTKRAFLNGKLDLAQAEAVAELIHSRSESAYRSSMAQLHGTLSSEIQSIRNHLIESVSLLELELDFVEDGYEFIDKQSVCRQVQQARRKIGQLLDSYRAGRMYRDGVKVVIAGAPNAGKSSLLNALLQTNRAIVTDIPGTTRDVIEECISIDGVEFRLADTAGLRPTADLAEKEGVRRTEEQISHCEVLLFVIDSTNDISDDEKRVVIEVDRKAPASATKVIAFNKIDLLDQVNGEAEQKTKFLGNYPRVNVSAKTGQGIGDLKKLLLESVFYNRHISGDSSIFVTNARHYDALRRAGESLSMAEESLQKGQSGEFAAVDLRRALDSLGEITGEVTTDEILNNIFSKFCIGK